MRWRKTPTLVHTPDCSRGLGTGRKKPRGPIFAPSCFQDHYNMPCIVLDCCHSDSNARQVITVSGFTCTSSFVRQQTQVHGLHCGVFWAEGTLTGWTALWCLWAEGTLTGWTALWCLLSRGNTNWVDCTVVSFWAEGTLMWKDKRFNKILQEFHFADITFCRFAQTIIPQGKKS